MKGRDLSPSLLAAGVFAAVTGWFALGGASREHPLFAGFTVLVTAALLASGFGLRRSRRGRKVGLALMLTAALWPVYWADVGNEGGWELVSWADEHVIWCIFGTGLLSFPDNQRLSHTERWYLVVLWGLSLVGGAALTVVSRPAWNGFSAGSWWPTVQADRAVFVVVLTIVSFGRLVVAVTGTLLLTSRLRAASGLDRTVLRPALAGVFLAVVIVATTNTVRTMQARESVNVTTAFLQGLALLLVPAVLLLSVVRTRLARAEMVELIMRIPRPSSAEAVQTALRTALRDESLEVLLWVPEYHSLVRPSGERMSAPDDDARFHAPLVGADGRNLGMITGDPRLRQHEQIVEAVVSAAALELENVALQAGLRAQMEQMQSSRARLVEVGLAERRRLERDLHDGAQQHMLAIALRIEHARHRTTEPEIRESLERIKVEMSQALAEMRDLAHGIQPGVLVQAGLRPALQTLTDGMPLPVHIDIPEQRYPQQAESAAYFVVSEALSNIVKHAQASRATVSIHRVDGRLRVEVTDDGTGAVRSDQGSGLRGISDRVHGLGGELTVTGHPRAGTRIEASIPCE